MAGAPHILLMGLRASGKSTLGQALAARLGLLFVDLDEVTAAMLGCVDVPEVWAMHGPAAFRSAEVGALRQLLAGAGPGGTLAGVPRVIALGGGTPTAPGAAELLREEARAGRIALVYLRASPETLRARLTDTDLDERPSLTGQGVLDEVDEIFRQRDPLYSELATARLETDGMTPAQAEDALARIFVAA